MISILNFTQGQSRAVIYIGAFLFGGVFAFGSDLLLFRSGQRALKSRSNIEINKLMDMPECDIYWSPEEFLKKEAYEEFLTRAARHASEHISDDTKEYQVWLVPAHGSEARGWPFVSHKASTTVHVFRYAKNGGVLEAKSQFEVCQTNHDSFSLLGMLGR